MHFYNFHPADFNNSARHLTLVERALYRDLIDMYYGDEQPIDVSDVARLERRLLCRTQDEKDALAYVLSEFFVKRGNKYHHHRIDREIKNYRHAHRNDRVTATVTDNNAHRNERNGNSNATVTEVTPLSNAERQQRNRAERKQMIDDLNMIGVSVTTNAGTKLLRELTDINADAIRNAKLSNTDDSNVTDSNTHRNDSVTDSNGKIAAITINHKPQTNNQLNKTTTTACESKFSKSVESVPVPPVTQFDIRTWDAPEYDNFLPVLMNHDVYITLTQDTYASEVEKFKAYNANQVAQGKTALADETYRMDKFVAWFEQLANKQSSAKPATAYAPTSDQCADDDLPPIYHQASQQPTTSYHPSHAKPVPKLDPLQSVMFNGVRKPFLPNMDQRQTYDYVMSQQRPGESSDETYDRLHNEIHLEVMA